MEFLDLLANLDPLRETLWGIRKGEALTEICSDYPVLADAQRQQDVAQNQRG